ncbi:MAG: glutathione S-transferase N-terminal domain-containing protein [Alphaproteobacteria bacterium]|nr:glutathione S-transferase N-terminal domain-containing protein [Alphaproteobacteria bacterium]
MSNTDKPDSAIRRSLYYSPNSPYARKCRIIIAEKKLEGIEQIEVNAMENPPELLAVNPLGTVPALVTDDGLHLCDSQLICEYLDGLPSAAPKLLTDDSGARLCIMALAEMAHGMMDAAVMCVIEGRRPPEKQLESVTQRKEKALLRTIEKISSANLDFTTPLTLGTLNLAIALLYVDFRLPHLGWRSKHAALAQWADEMKMRPSFAATAPK